MKSLSLFVGLLLPLATLHAESPLLSVDFNAGSRTPSPTNPGFEAFDVGVGDMTGPLSINFPVSDKKYPSGLAVSITSGKSEQDAGRLTGRAWKVENGGEAFRFADLYFDAICGADNNPLLLTVSGLRPGQKYELKCYTFSAVRPGSITVTDISQGEPADVANTQWSNDVVFSESSPEDEFAATLTAKTNANGKLVISIANKSGVPILNGFTLSEVKP